MKLYNDLIRFKRSESVNCFQNIWALPQLLKADYKFVSVISVHDWAADGEFLDLFLKSVKENSVYKEPCVLKEKKKNICLILLHVKYSKYKLENETLFSDTT